MKYTSNPESNWNGGDGTRGKSSIPRAYINRQACDMFLPSQHWWHALTERGKCDEQGGKQSLGKAKTVARYIQMQESSTDCLFFVRPKRAVVIDSTLLLKLQVTVPYGVM